MKLLTRVLLINFPGDAELACLAGRLAVEKPGGSLFADSALGRSTAAASVTTAGVTHLSEVSL